MREAQAPLRCENEIALGAQCAKIAVEAQLVEYEASLVSVACRVRLHVRQPFGTDGRLERGLPGSQRALHDACPARV